MSEHGFPNVFQISNLKGITATATSGAIFACQMIDHRGSEHEVLTSTCDVISRKPILRDCPSAQLPVCIFSVKKRLARDNFAIELI